MTQPTNKPQSELEAFLMRLSAVAASGGDVRAAVADPNTPKPANVPAVIDGSGGAVIWQRGEEEAHGRGGGRENV